MSDPREIVFLSHDQLKRLLLNTSVDEDIKKKLIETVIENLTYLRKKEDEVK